MTFAVLLGSFFSFVGNAYLLPAALLFSNHLVDLSFSLTVGAHSPQRSSPSRKLPNNPYKQPVSVREKYPGPPIPPNIVNVNCPALLSAFVRVVVPGTPVPASLLSPEILRDAHASTGRRKNGTRM